MTSITILNRYFVVALSIFAAVLLIDLAKGKEMLAESTQLSLYLHNEFAPFQNWIVQEWFVFCSKPLFYVISVFGFFALYFFNNKADALYFFLFLNYENVIGNLMKLTYADTRPCFENMEVSIIGCSCAFGKPSGHSSASNVFYTLLYFEFIHERNISPKIKTAIFVFTKWLIFNICLSRIYFGAHSFNQVIMGYMLGEVLISIYLNLKPYKHLLRTALSPSSYKDIQIKNSVCNFIISLQTIIALFLIIGWYMRVNYFEQSPYHPYAHSNCVKKCFKRPTKLLSNIHLISAGFFNSVIFIFLLIKFKVRNADVPLEENRRARLQLSIILQRAVIFIICMIPLGIAARISTEHGFLTYLLVNALLILFSVNLVVVSGILMKRRNCAFAGDFGFVEEKLTFDSLIED